jgi:hypothetical protein
MVGRVRSNAILSGESPPLREDAQFQGGRMVWSLARMALTLRKWRAFEGGLNRRIRCRSR